MAAPPQAVYAPQVGMAPPPPAAAMGWPTQPIVTSYGPPQIVDVSEDRAKIRKAAMFSLAAVFIQVCVCVCV